MQIILSYPHKDLMPNRKNGRHYSSTRKVKAAAIKDSFYATKEALPNVRLHGKTALNITFIQTDKINRDLDNLLAAAKPYLDAMADALKVNDKHFEPITIQRGYGDKAMMVIQLGVSNG
jgi:crossover junction endodeoxyribonuclease RusA